MFIQGHNKLFSHGGGKFLYMLTSGLHCGQVTMSRYITTNSNVNSETMADKEFPSMSMSKPIRRIKVDLTTQPAKNSSEKSAISRSQDDEKYPSISYMKKQRTHSKEHFVPNSKPKITSPFDICTRNNSESLMCSRDPIVAEYPITETRQILRPGMVLLTNYISLPQQVNIINRCRELGLGSGGFYQPGYQTGAKLNLQMLCLGRRWDPETKYEEHSKRDSPETIGIPDEFVMLVKKALSDAHFLIKKNVALNNVEDMLPEMSPDICIVNFYETNGKLGLHQDRDESKDSLRRGVPVVSLSVGDSAEFLYGDKRDITQAERISLKSGDVLIFGGESRHIYHGVTSINSNTAPPALLKATNLRPGRLNLTFRQF